MVLDAIDLYDEIGTDSFESFNSSPDFHKSDLYMFVFRDYDSIMVAHGANMDLIGKSVDKILDIYGESIGKMIHQKATKEGVWVEYLWEDPVDKKVHPKNVWVVKHDGYIFGTGSYSDAEPDTLQHTDEQLEKRTTPLEVIIPIGSPLVGCENLNTCYVPYQAEIYSGESIIWKNVDSEPHTITSGFSDAPTGIFDSGIIMASESFEFAFTDSGEYDYYCTVHPWMTGKIMVREIPLSEGSGTILDDESDRDYDVMPGETEKIVKLLPGQELHEGDDGTKSKIPDWVKNTMQWFSQGLISEQEMINGIQFLVSEGIINIEEPLQEPKVKVVEAKISDDQKNVKIKADLFGFDVKDISKLVVSVYLLDFETGKTVFTKIIGDTKKVIQQNEGEEKINVDELVLIEKDKEKNTSQIELDVELINGGDKQRLGVNVGIDDGKSDDFGSLVIEAPRSEDD